MTAARLDTIPPLPPTVHGRAKAAQLPFPLDQPGCRLFARARHGLWQGVQALGLEVGAGVLVPAYHHGSEVEALLAAGLEPRFYAGDSNLEPDAEELESLLTPSVRALYLIHYLGFPQRAGVWRKWCDERGLLLIEDAAQAWLAQVDGQPVGSFGDLAVFCLYKTFGVPDGAALHLRGPGGGHPGTPAERVPGPDAAAARGVLAAGRRHAAWVLQHSTVASLVIDGRRGERRYDPFQDFALGDAGSPPTIATQYLLHRIADSGVPARRRGNYAMLLEELSGRVPPPFDELDPSASPFALPIEDDAKRRTIERLAAHGIAAVDFWSVAHPALPIRRFPDAARRRSRTIILPVHQELGYRDVERIAAAARGGGRQRPEPRLEPVESFDAVKDEWTELATRMSNVFSTWEWATTWWRHYGTGRSRHLIGVRRADGRLLGILPLYLYSNRPRVVRFIGHGQADELGPVCAPADRPAMARALRRALAELRVDMLVAERFVADQGWSALLGGHVVSSDGSPVVDLRAPDWDGQMATWSANLRKALRKAERKLDKEHGLRYRLASDPGRLQADLDLLFALHDASRPDGSSEFAVDEDFHRDFAAVALERDWLRLWLLEADGEAVAAELVYRFAGADASYQSGRNPDWEHSSVGTVLMARAIRAALEDGVREYRLLRGGETYKYRFASRDPGVETIVVPGHRVAAGAVVARRAMPERLRVPLRRRVRR